jgi:2-amino-4-hydroxy-6-hydroxymethyldihydropteridine diphosphokinase
MPRALIGLGSNLGDRRATLDAAMRQFGGLPQTAVVSTSSWYETAPIGGPLGQEPFLNGCTLLETSLTPESLLEALQRIETSLGRVREVPWGPRTLDLDLLLYDDQVLDSPRLRVPHPRLSFRKFVLRGATEIAADMRHPVLERTLGELSAHLHRTPRYVGMTGSSSGFRTQFAGEAAHAATARLAEPTPAGIAASVDDLLMRAAGSHGLSASAAIEFLHARTAAVAQSIADAGEAWVVDDAWPAAEAATLLEQLPRADRDRFRSEATALLSSEVTPRLVVGLGGFAAARDLRRIAPELVTLPPWVAVDVADREAALTEIAAALDAAS